jgi:hypothetical protein
MTVATPDAGTLRRIGRLATLAEADWTEPLDALDASGVPTNALGIGGASFLRNLPAQGAYAVNEAAFNAETERNDVALQPVNFTGLGGAPMDLRIPNNGILTNVRLVFDGTLTVSATGTTTSGYQFPWNAPWKLVTLNANGQTSLISAEGMDLRMRRQRIWRNPKDDITISPAIVAGSADPAPAAIASGAQRVRITVDIPIVHDDSTLIGALFAQSDQNNLSVRISPAAVTDLFTLAGGAPAPTFTGTIAATATFYDIPMMPVNGVDQVIVPNLAWLHGYLAGDYQYANTGNVRAPFIRTAGQLLAYGFYIDNGGQTQIDVGGAAVTEVRFGYGGNRKPRVLNPPAVGLEKQGRDYNGLLRPGWWLWDFEIDNPQRDLVYPKGVTELAVEVNIAQGTTINANARIHFVEDTLFTGR